MKKYLILVFVFLLTAFPIFAKNDQVNSNNQNKRQIQNQISDTETETGTEEIDEVEDEDVDEVEESTSKISEQVKKILEDRGDEKRGIGLQVREIAENQEKKQEEIKKAYYELKNRGQLIRLFVGSDKKMTQALEQLNNENKLEIEKLIALKNQTMNEADKAQLQETIGTLTTQNTQLEEKIAKEKQANGLFGWFVKLFSKKE